MDEIQKNKPLSYVERMKLLAAQRASKAGNEGHKSSQTFAGSGAQLINASQAAVIRLMEQREFAILNRSEAINYKFYMQEKIRLIQENDLEKLSDGDKSLRDHIKQCNILSNYLWIVINDSNSKISLSQNEQVGMTHVIFQTGQMGIPPLDALFLPIMKESLLHTALTSGDEKLKKALEQVTQDLHSSYAEACKFFDVTDTNPVNTVAKTAFPGIVINLPMLDLAEGKMAEASHGTALGMYLNFLRVEELLQAVINGNEVERFKIKDSIEGVFVHEITHRLNGGIKNITGQLTSDVDEIAPHAVQFLYGKDIDFLKSELERPVSSELNHPYNIGRARSLKVLYAKLSEYLSSNGRNPPKGCSPNELAAACDEIRLLDGNNTVLRNLANEIASTQPEVLARLADSVVLAA